MCVAIVAPHATQFLGLYPRQHCCLGYTTFHSTEMASVARLGVWMDSYHLWDQRPCLYNTMLKGP